jgi:hypothetical protein
MRVKIKHRTFSARTPFVFVLLNENVEVWRKDAVSGHLTWKWIDGSFASMRIPNLHRDPITGEFCAGRLEVTSAVFGGSGVEWRCNDKTLVVKQRCCSGDVSVDGRRLVFWRLLSGGAECVIRKSLSSELRNIVLGITVGHIFQDND